MNAIIKEILAEYDRLRDLEELKLKERELEVEEKVPAIKDIRQQMISILAQQSIKLIKNPQCNDSSMEILKNEIDRLKNKEKELLVSNGFDPDYLCMRYRCEKCKDTGFVGQLVKEKCRCLTQKLIDRMYGDYNTDEFNSENFDTFDINVFPDYPLDEVSLTQREYMDKVRERLFEYQKQYPHNKQKTILFTGKTGLGKTFLLNCLARSILDKGGTVLKVTSYNLFEQLFNTKFKSSSSANALKERIFKVDTLIIDDLGTETKRNNFTAEELFNILNERFLARKHTFVSTNLTLTQLKEAYSDRVTSRLFDVDNTIIIRFLGQDLRLRARQNS